MSRLSVIFISCLCSLGAFSSGDSLAKERKCWKVGIEGGSGVYFLKDRMPFYKNDFSFNNEIAAVLSKPLNKSIAFNIRAGIGYSQYHLTVPDLDHFFATPLGNGYAQPYCPVDSFKYKQVKFRNINFSFSYAFMFRQNKKFEWGLGGSLLYYIVPESISLRESYYFNYDQVSLAPVTNQVTQKNELYYSSYGIVSMTNLVFGYKTGKGEVLIRISKSLVPELLRQKYYNTKQLVDCENYYFNGSGGWNVIDLSHLMNSGTGIFVSYRYNL